ncbi:MAG: thioredoxin domain-containing protein [Jaaginema sp. PMC 1080.18]|nr:thioredoxin domain-containing protein [Jaaginema sp. PMC 1080.18]
MSNRLVNTASLYLRKHAENPINWWYWCDEALETAKRENKPIFLSIGYSSCHWCTVMEGEAFSDNAIASYLNDNFLPIKVDREERPDIDSIYMQALQMMTGQGGWPLNIFLTPDDRVPFYGGTYFPVQPRYGRPGFLEILQSVRRFYDVETEKLTQFKSEIMRVLQESASLPRGDNTLDKALLLRGMEISSRIIASQQPGQPSFPMMPYALLTLQGGRLAVSEAVNIAKQRGMDLVLGGIYDQVGGGFHRYTVDDNWTVPHFEKMLYDNGQILEFLANLWSCGIEESAIERAIAGTIEWLQREMIDSQGFFYAAQDADSFITPQDAEPEEGAFYVWDYGELDEILTPGELQEMQTAFTVTLEGNFEGHNVLQRRNKEKLSETTEIALSKLFKVRYGEAAERTAPFPPARNNSEAKNQTWPGRIPAVTDTKMIVAWNSLIISGLARVCAVLGDETAWNLAQNAANFILENQWLEGRFHRLNYAGKTAVLAQSEDYALFIKALLDLYAAKPTETQWLDAAINLQREFDQYLWSEESGGYYNTPNDASDDLIIRERSYMDNATPAANGMAIANLMRLSLVADNPDWGDRAAVILQAFSAIMEKSPQACPSLFHGLDWYHHGTLVRTTPDILQTLIPQYSPGVAYQVETELPPNTVGLVCQGMSCLEPAQSLEQLLQQLAASQS